MSDMQMKFVIVEDEPLYAESLSACIGRYAKESHMYVEVKHYYDAESFLADYKPVYGIVFMDINLPGINGLDCALQLREKDRDVLIMFVTNLARFALRGYEVNAVDFIVKPIIYADFALKLDRAVKIAANMSSEEGIMVRDGINYIRISVRQLMYVEVIKHYLYYHTVTGPVKVRGVFQDAEKALYDYGFIKCNKSFLVNARFISSVSNGCVTVGKEKIYVSRLQSRSFMSRLAEIMNLGRGV